MPIARIKLKIFLLLVFVVSSSFAQDSLYARRIVDTLTSPYFWGRGYTKKGVQKAAQFIEGEFNRFGLRPLAGNDFMQYFSYDVNTFPGKMNVNINGVSLKPGRDYIISPESRGVEFSGGLEQRDSITFVNPGKRIIVILQDKLTWSVAQKAEDYTALLLRKGALSSIPSTIDANIENKEVKSFITGNICGMVRGTAKPDSFLVMTAHYDHLGGMGADTYFPGANDNASGVSQLLSLAKYYAAHPQPYSMVFICFSGEEAGLLGSMYFASHPLVPLPQIRFLINLDIEGTGGDGITVVNATEYPKEFEQMQKANTAGHYLVKVYPRGKAPNSDHYPFTEKGVPAFYLYTMGGIKAYHDVFDISKTLPLNEYNHLFKLLVDFNAMLMK
ncbi:MAG TPA: M28 family peptidase [Mucilaginibacter sp.]|nr:M28 family peptidase [Mucilaginibacter sp.]